MRTWTLRLFLQFLDLALSALHVLAAATSAAFKSRTTLHLENLALRHQLGVLRRSVKRPKLTSADRLLWAWLYKVWNDWRSSLVQILTLGSAACPPSLNGSCFINTPVNGGSAYVAGFEVAFQQHF